MAERLLLVQPGQALSLVLPFGNRLAGYEQGLGHLLLGEALFSAQEPQIFTQGHLAHLISMVREATYLVKHFPRNVRLRPLELRRLRESYFLFSQARPSASVSQKLTWLLRLQVKMMSRMGDW